MFTRDFHAVQSHSKLILPMINDLLQEADADLQQMNGIVFGAGPGSFTGLRIACGVAQGLAFGVQAPVIGVSTLLSLAEQSNAQRVIACLDARMGEVYHAVYEKNNDDWLELQAPALYAPQNLPVIHGDGWVGVGSGWQAYGHSLRAHYAHQVEHVCPEIQPTASSMLRLALPEFLLGKAMPAHMATPIYIRNKVAFTTQERAAR